MRDMREFINGNVEVDDVLESTYYELRNYFLDKKSVEIVDKTFKINYNKMNKRDRELYSIAKTLELFSRDFFQNY